MYSKIFKYVKHKLNDDDNSSHFAFRTRSEHILRVFNWAKKLIENSDFDNNIDKESVLIAALFHDVGYSQAKGEGHATKSAEMFIEYAKNVDFDIKNIEFIEYLINTHSQKDLLKTDIPLELVVLMEADLLDETGAISIVWDCMMEGSKKEQSFEKTYEHIKNFTAKTMSANPMKTEIAKKYWFEKQKLVTEFIHQLETDLMINL